MCGQTGKAVTADMISCWLEFKVHEADEEESLEDTVQSALKQIREKNYDAGLTAAGIQKEKIRYYGFAFEGKKVLIGK